MQAEYRRDLQHNYLILEVSEERAQKDYGLIMAEQNEIPGLLPFHSAGKDGKLYLHYEITSKQPLENVYEKRLLGSQELLFLLSSIQEVLNQMQKYLLNPVQLIFDPQYIYIGSDRKRLEFCYLPEEKEERQIGLFAEFLLKRLDHEDRRAVEIGYQFYQKTLEENFSLKKALKEILSGQHKFDIPGKEDSESGEEAENCAGGWSRDIEDGRVETGGRRESNGGRESGGRVESAARNEFAGKRESIGRRESTGRKKSAGRGEFVGGRKSAGNAGSDEIPDSRAKDRPKTESKTGRKAGQKSEGSEDRPDDLKNDIWSEWSAQREAGVYRRDFGSSWQGTEKNRERTLGGGAKRNAEKRKDRSESEEDAANYNVTHVMREKEEEPKKLTDRLFQAVHPAVLLSCLGLLAALEIVYYLGIVTLTEAGGLFFLVISAEMLVNQFWKRKQEEKKEIQSRWIEQEESEMYQLLQEEMYQAPRQEPEIEETRCLAAEPVKTGMRLICVRQESSKPAVCPEILIGTGTVLVGKRKEEVDVILDSPTVSRLHAQLKGEKGMYYVRDLNSRNGTFCNGERLVPQELRQIAAGDRISFAEIEYLAVQDG